MTHVDDIPFALKHGGIETTVTGVKDGSVSGKTAYITFSHKVEDIDKKGRPTGNLIMIKKGAPAFELKVSMWGCKESQYSAHEKAKKQVGMGLKSLDQVEQLERAVFDSVKRALCKPETAKQIYEPYFKRAFSKGKMSADLKDKPPRMWSSQEQNQFADLVAEWIVEEGKLVFTKADETFNKGSSSAILSSREAETKDSREFMPTLNARWTETAEGSGVPRISYYTCDEDMKTEPVKGDPADLVPELKEYNKHTGKRTYEKFSRTGFAMLKVGFIFIKPCGGTTINLELTGFRAFNQADREQECVMRWKRPAAMLASDDEEDVTEEPPAAQTNKTTANKVEEERMDDAVPHEEDADEEDQKPTPIKKSGVKPKPKRTKAA